MVKYLCIQSVCRYGCWLYYFSSTILRKCLLYNEIVTRFQKASDAFGKLEQWDYFKRQNQGYHVYVLMLWLYIYIYIWNMTCLLQLFETAWALSSTMLVLNTRTYVSDVEEKQFSNIDCVGVVMLLIWMTSEFLSSFCMESLLMKSNQAISQRSILRMAWKNH